MHLTPTELRSKEDVIFHVLEHAPNDTTFLGRLYRDGAPSPQAYLDQRVRVLFVFREPNLLGKTRPHDMRDEVSDGHFRPLGPDGERQDRPTTGWWNWKAGMFAHAVAAALEDEPWQKAFDRFFEGGWNHKVVNRFAYIQIKKIGGVGTSNVKEICAHAATYAATLRQQVDLYQPHLLLGCGAGRHAPARLFAEHVLVGGRNDVMTKTHMHWWEYSSPAHPRAMVQLWHPAKRGLKSAIYQDVWHSIHEVVHKVGLDS